jgi:HAMP domain-containing protein
MVAPVSKVDSNISGLRYAEEQTIGTLPGSPKWVPLEPNSYSDFGGEVKTVARKPINPSRQSKKGVTVDLDAKGGFATDLTQTNLQDLLQGFLFADLRTKAELSVLNVKKVAAEEDYEPAAGGAAFKANDLLFAKNFTIATNNGLKKVSSAVAASVVVMTALAAEGPLAAPGGTISRVGHEFNAGDFRATTPAGNPVFTTELAGKDLTELGLIPGEWIYIGGDAVGEKFATCPNMWARVKSVAAHALEVDKTSATVAADAGAGKTVRIFLGRVLKNETGTSIKRRTYQLERTLGAPDSDLPAQIQSEYLVGAVPNELTLNVGVAEKITAELSFLATSAEQRTGATGVKSGDRPALVEADAFNTSSDFSRIKMSVVGSATALFAFLSELKLTLKNNISPLKAVGTLGSFDVAAGTFEVAGSVTAYFADVAAMAAVRNNSDVTLDVAIVKANKGIAIDIPMICLGDGKANVEMDQPIKLPLKIDAATGAKYDTNMDHTLLFVFFDYLPTAADV